MLHAGFYTKQQQALLLQQHHFPTCTRHRCSKVVCAANNHAYRSESSALSRGPSDSSKQRPSQPAAADRQQQQRQQPQQQKKKGKAGPADTKQRTPQSNGSKAAAVALKPDDLGCAHFGPCSGCTLNHGLWTPPVVSEAQQFFSSRGFEGFIVQQGRVTLPPPPPAPEPLCPPPHYNGLGCAHFGALIGVCTG